MNARQAEREMEPSQAITWRYYARDEADDMTIAFCDNIVVLRDDETN